jgi:predicted nucleotidyltransferase
LPPALNAERFRLLAEVEWDDGATKLSTEYLERALAWRLTCAFALCLQG